MIFERNLYLQKIDICKSGIHSMVFGVVLVALLLTLNICCSVSIVDYEHVIAGRVKS